MTYKQREVEYINILTHSIKVLEDYFEETNRKIPDGDFFVEVLCKGMDFFHEKHADYSNLQLLFLFFSDPRRMGDESALFFLNMVLIEKDRFEKEKTTSPQA